MILGWKDYRENNPYPYTYDDWDEIDQRNYENGRMRAANYQTGNGGFLPENPVSRKVYLTISDKIGAAFYDPRKNDSQNIPHIQDARQHKNPTSF